MAFTEVYIDPSIDADSGDGLAPGTAYGDLEYGVEQSSLGAGGTRFSIIGGTDEILAAELSAALATAGITPTVTAPVVFQGCTATAGDGGKGGISGGGSVSVYNDPNLDFVHFIDLHCHNTGSNPVLLGDNNCSVIRCEVDNTSGNGIDFDVGCLVAECYVHDIGAVGINVSSFGNIVMNNYCVNGTKSFTTAISLGAGSIAFRNIIEFGNSSNTSVGISMPQNTAALHNSIYSNGGTGAGIQANSNVLVGPVLNNIVEGFSGLTGNGIFFGNSGTSLQMYGGNAVFDCDTEYEAPAEYVLADLGDNETLTASAFTDPSAQDFSPVDTGNVKEGSLPQDIGDGEI